MSHFRIMRRCFSSGGQPLITTTITSSTKQINLNSPNTRNALSNQMMKELRREVQKSAREPSIRCLVLRASGPVFSSGHNLKELTSEQGMDHHKEVFDTCNALMKAVFNSPVPVIACVSSGQLAAAAGCQLVSACDIVLAAKGAKFSTPGGNFGLYCSTPGVPLARMVPRKVSSYMLLTGIPIDAEEALMSGLISKLSEDDAGLEEELELVCDAIAAKPKAVIELGKSFYRQQLEMGLADALEAGGRVMVGNLRLSDAQEGIAAFKEKRKPKWTHGDGRAH